MWFYIERMNSSSTFFFFKLFFSFFLSLSLSSICGFSNVFRKYFSCSPPFGLVRISRSVFFSQTWPALCRWEFTPGLVSLLFLSTLGVDKSPCECNCLSLTQYPNMKFNSHFYGRTFFLMSEISPPFIPILNICPLIQLLHCVFRILFPSDEPAVFLSYMLYSR